MPHREQLHEYHGADALSFMWSVPGTLIHLFLVGEGWGGGRKCFPLNLPEAFLRFEMPPLELGFSIGRHSQPQKQRADFMMLKDAGQHVRKHC